MIGQVGLFFGEKDCGFVSADFELLQGEPKA